MNFDNYNLLGQGTSSNVPASNYTSEIPSVQKKSSRITVDLSHSDFRLSGAGIRRFKRLLEAGVPVEEAKIRARVPKKQMDPVVEAKISKPLANKLANDSTSYPDFPGIIIGIMHLEHPHVRLTSDELLAVEEMIVDKIVELGRGTVLRPKFLKMVHGDGFIELTCADRATAEWLKRLEHKLKPWRDATLVVKEDTVYTSRETLVGYFPYRVHCNIEKMLKLIDAQNEGIYSHTWNILENKILDNKLKLVFSVDMECLNLLTLRGLKINYQFDQVLLKKYEPVSESTRSMSNVGSLDPSFSNTNASASMDLFPLETNPFRM